MDEICASWWEFQLMGYIDDPEWEAKTKFVLHFLQSSSSVFLLDSSLRKKIILVMFADFTQSVFNLIKERFWFVDIKLLFSVLISITKACNSSLQLPQTFTPQSPSISFKIKGTAITNLVEFLGWGDFIPAAAETWKKGSVARLDAWT